MIVLLLPVFNKVSGKDLSGGDFLGPWHTALLAVFSICVGLINRDLYPAFVLSSFKPIARAEGTVHVQ